MIGRTLVFLRDDLDAYLKSALDVDGDPGEDRVVFVDGDKLDPLTFKSGAITELLVNLEEERQLRPPDLYARRTEDGTPRGKAQRGQPDIRLVLYVLFVARFRDYDVAWEHLSRIIERFQSLRLFERSAFPSLPPSVERLVLELLPLDFTRQNEIWNSLRITHHPSVLYRVTLVTFRDAQLTTPEVVREAPIRRIKQSSSNA